MPQADVRTTSITTIIRAVNKVSHSTERTIDILLPYVDQILILFSGKEDEYLSLTDRYKNFDSIEILWVYSFGYGEPILLDIKDRLKNPWMMFLTDRDIPSDTLLKSLPYLTQRDVDGYIIERIWDENIENRNMPRWLKDMIGAAYHQGSVLLCKKDKIVISEVIHTPYTVQGKIEFLDPARYYVVRSYDLEDMESDETFVSHWIEKESRYLLIEMFETRKSRAGALAKIIEKVPLGKDLGFRLPHWKFLYSELSNFEYSIFELRHIRFHGFSGLTMYSKIKLRTIKEIKKINAIGFLTSEFLRAGNIRLVNFLNLQSSVIDTNRSDFEDMAVVTDSEVAFIKHFLSKFIEYRGEIGNVDINGLVEKVKSCLENNINRYFPR